MQSVAPGLHILFPNSQQEIQTCISLPVSALDRPSQDPTTTNNTAHEMLQTYPVSSRQDAAAAAAAAVKMHCIALSYSSQPQSMPSGPEKVPERQAVLSNKQESSHRPREQKKKKARGKGTRQPQPRPIQEQCDSSATGGLPTSPTFTGERHTCSARTA